MLIIKFKKIFKDGYQFTINNTCSYIIATDSCDGDSDFNYQVIVNHERRYGFESLSYIRSIRIKFYDDEYQIDSQFKVNIKTEIRL